MIGGQFVIIRMYIFKNYGEFDCGGKLLKTFFETFMSPPLLLTIPPCRNDIIKIRAWHHLVLKKSKNVVVNGVLAY